MMNILVIPSAKLVDEELRKQFGDIPSVLIPVEGRTVLDILYDKYKEKISKVYIVGYENHELISEYLSNRYKDVDLLIVDRLADIGYTLKFSLDYIIENNSGIDNLIINFGDTYINGSVDVEGDTICYSHTIDAKRWTTFDYEGNNITKIYDKQNQSLKEVYNSFIGVFCVSGVKSFHEILKEYVGSNSSVCTDSFYRTILDYNKKYGFLLKYTDEWIDLGHQDHYYNNINKIKPRFFNTIKVDRIRGLLTKYSTDTSKFINEIKWYLKLPSNIQYLSPRIFNYSFDFEKPFITMEYYSYNTLHEMFLYGNYSLDKWKLIFNSIFTSIKEMSKYKLEVEKSDVYETLYGMYVEKTVSRLNQMRENNMFKTFFENKIRINNNSYCSIDYYIEKLPELMGKCNIYNIKYLNIIHGDLCFTNILYDTTNNFIRLIDPRGQFGKYDIYGDVRYDIAKLSHSVVGKYDFLVEDLFHVTVDGNSIKYYIFNSKRHQDIEGVFLSKLEQEHCDIDSVTLLQSLLFLSMIPLHKDYPKRQFVMLSKGIELLHPLLKSKGV